MHITRYTDYAVRILVYLAIQERERCTIRVIADSYGISKNHLMKIVQQLNAAGYLQATRGKNGGLRLREPPERINIGALIRELEDDRSLAECFGEANRCVITSSCQMRNIFASALDSFYLTLDAYTLQDLLGPEHRNGLQRILLT